MPTAIFHTTMSLDGFTAGMGGAMDWMFVDGEPGPAADEVIDRMGGILAGRRSWDPNPALAADERTAKPYGGRWSGPDRRVNPPARGATGRPRRHFRLWRRRGRTGRGLREGTWQGRRTVRGVASQCLRAGLVGELTVHIVPVLLGRGAPLFPVADDGDAVPLELVDSYQSGQILTLRLRPRS